MGSFNINHWTSPTDYVSSFILYFTMFLVPVFYYLFKVVYSHCKQDFLPQLEECCYLSFL